MINVDLLYHPRRKRAELAMARDAACDQSRLANEALADRHAERAATASMGAQPVTLRRAGTS